MLLGPIGQEPLLKGGQTGHCTNEKNNSIYFPTSSVAEGSAVTNIGNGFSAMLS
nr:hypothetical protein [Niallia taxi]